MATPITTASVPGSTVLMGIRQTTCHSRERRGEQREKFETRTIYVWLEHGRLLVGLTESCSARGVSGVSRERKVL
jgi:hypothetical protein